MKRERARALRVWADAHTFSSERLRFRPPFPEDAPAVLGTYDDEVRRWQGWRDGTYRGRLSTQALAVTYGLASVDHCAPTLLVCTADGTIVGDYQLQAARSTTEVALGWSLGPAGRGQGYGAESLPAVLGYIHRHVGVPSVRMGTDVTNVRALRQIESVGAIVVDEGDHELDNGSVVRGRWFVHEDPVVRQHLAEHGAWPAACRSDSTAIVGR